MARIVERKVKPVSPAKVKAVEKVIPDAVLEVFNQQITAKFNGQFASIMTKDVVAALQARGFKEQEIFEKRLLDVEEIYGKSGWRVVYDSPDRGENYFEPSFVFSPRKS